MTGREAHPLVCLAGPDEGLDGLAWIGTGAARTEHQAALREVIEAALATDDPKTWEARLTAADVPCACIWKIDEIVRHPQLEHRDVLQTVD